MNKDGVSGPATLKDEALDFAMSSLVSLREASLTGQLTSDILISYLYSQQAGKSNLYK